MPSTGVTRGEDNQRAKRSHRAFVKTGNLAQAIGRAGKIAGLARMWVAMATAEPGSMDQHGRLYLHTHTDRIPECSFVHLIFYLYMENQGANCRHHVAAPSSCHILSSFCFRFPSFDKLIRIFLPFPCKSQLERPKWVRKNKGGANNP